MNGEDYNTDEALEYIRSSTPNASTDELQEILKTLGSKSEIQEYAKGGSVTSNWFSGELSFLNW